ncbi:MAG TPA: T9SS type A sorting domain-containing protein [Chitinophagales bacterium]|nr:T9SS type A sorting domain-containing protein [Chitinophagales bacterium]
MKKFTSAVFLLLILSSAKSQTIPNNDFENWSIITYYDDPAGFWTSNYQSYFNAGLANVIQSSNAVTGQYSAHLKTLQTPGGIVSSLVSIGIPGPMFSGGLPIDHVPDSISWYMNYNIMSGDSGVFLLIFKKLGNLVAFAAAPITGSQPTYQHFELPVTTVLPLPPDSFVFAIISSASTNPQAGSTLEVDNIQFIDSLGAVFPNGDFEDWNSVTTEDPDYWTTSNLFNVFSSPSVTKSTDTYNGYFAAQIENQPSISGVPTSFLILGKLGQEGPHGGFPVSSKPSKLSGHYKYAPMGNDSGLVIAGMTKWNPFTQHADSAGEYAMSLQPSLNYTYFEMTFDTGGVIPDTMLIGFSPSFVSDSNSSVTEGSTLIVDDLLLDFATGVSMPLNDYLLSLNSFPIPCNQNLNLHFILGESSHLSLVIYDASGIEVQNINYGWKEKGNISLATPVDDLASGNYFYSLKTDKGVVNGKFEVGR